MKHYHYLRLLFLLLLFLSATIFAANPKSLPQKTATLPSKMAMAIGHKIWQNECAGKISGLTSWNQGEGFPSLGIGHFIWYPKKPNANFTESFPLLIKYMQAHGISNIPDWLNQKVVPPCPWATRAQFMQAQNSPKMLELRGFLVRTIPIQAQYMMHRFKATIPRILANIPAAERKLIYRELYHLMQTEQGIYALVDYVNFKGDGINTEKNGAPQRTYDWGLLQVLRAMPYAPSNLTPLQAYAWAAKYVLIHRVLTAPANHHEEKWLPGWLNRINTYTR